MNRPPLSNDNIDSILRHREVGWAKGYQHPLIRNDTVACVCTNEVVDCVFHPLLYKS